MKKTIIFANESFELVSASKVPTLDSVMSTCGKTLYDCYQSCSHLKENAFEYWRDWVYECEKTDNCSIVSFGVHSANSNTFSITCILRNLIDNKCYIIYITKDHNRACEVKNHE